MNKTLIHAAFTLALGTASLGASAVAFPSFPMTITAGVTTYDGDGYAANVTSGSWFAMDTSGNSLISGTEKTALSQGCRSCLRQHHLPRCQPHRLTHGG